MKKILSTRIGAGFCGFLLFVLWIVIFTEIFSVQNLKTFPHWFLIVVSIMLLYGYLRGLRNPKP